VAEKRLAVVTGGAGAIGGAIVSTLAAAGHRTVVLDRAECDLADADDVRRAAAGVGRCDVLVHAAAAFDQAGLHAVDLAAWRRVQAVNVESALLGLTRVLAVALGGDGITVNAVAPDLTRTPSAEQGIRAETFDAVVAGQAVPRPLVPDDVAGTVAFLASDAAGALTGQTLCVDGGLVLH